jgi:WD40 repeat protein
MVKPRPKLDPQRVQDAFAEASGLPTLARGAYLARLRAESPDLADEVGSLLGYHHSHRHRAGLIPDDPTMSLPATMVGTTIAGCHLDSLLGYGGMSVVYAATQDFPRRRVAVKIVRRERLSASARRRLRVEAEALARLEHPNIARVYAAGTHEPGEGERGDDGEGASPYIVMELVEHAVPISRWADERSLPPRARIELVSRIAAAIEHAHQAGVIHRDLKPGNVIVGPDGVPKVIDFGIATVVDSTVTAATEGPMGTLAYMSPEQARGGAIDTRSDIWGLGALLYDLLTGHPPFDAGDRSVADHIDRLLHDTAQPVIPTARVHRGADFAMAIPPATDAVLRKALATEPERRYRSAGELADELRRLVAGEPLIARPDSEWDALVRLARRNRAPLVAASGVLASIVAALVVSVALLRRESAAHRRAEWAAYIASLAAANSMLEGGDASAASEMLASAPASLRGWEWRVLAQRADQVRWSIPFPEGHQVYGLWYSADGGTLFTAASRYYSAIDTATRTERWRNAITPEGPVAWRARPLDDGRCLLQTLDEAVRLIDADGELLRMQAIPRVIEIDLGLDQSTFFVNAEGGADEYDTETLTKIREIRANPPLGEFPRAIAVSPDATLIVTGDRGGEAVAFEARSGTVRWRWKPASRLTEIRAVRVSPDGRTVAACGGRHLALIDAVTGVPIWVRDDDGRGYRSPVFTPDGRELVVANYGETVDRFDLATGTRVGELFGANGQVWTVAVSPDGRSIAAGSFSARVDVFDARDSGAPLEFALDGSRVTSVSPGRRLLATTGDGGLFEIDRSSQKVASVAPPGIHANFVRAAPDGSVAIAHDTGVLLLDPSGAERLRITSTARAFSLGFLSGGAAIAVCFDDEREIAYSCDDGRALWSTTGARNGAHAACELADPNKLLLPMGELAASRLIDLSAGTDILWQGPLEYPFCAELSPDRRFVAVGSLMRDGEVAVLDARTLEIVLLLPNHRGIVWSLCWSADGSRLYSAATDGTVRAWHVKNQTELLTLWRGDCRDLALDADGTLWLACMDGKLRAIRPGDGL